MIAWAWAKLVNQLLVEALIAEPAVERFDIGVLIGFARFDQAQGDTAFMRPGQHGSAAELLGIIRAQHPREATDKRKAVECPGHRSSPEGASGDDGNRFGRGIIDNRQTLDHASIGRSVDRHALEQLLVPVLDHGEERPCDCSGMITVSATDEGLPRITAPVSGIDYDGSHTLPGFLLSSQ